MADSKDTSPQQNFETNDKMVKLQSTSDLSSTMGSTKTVEHVINPTTDLSSTMACTKTAERPVIDPTAEAALVRRLDLRILPWVGLLYLFAYLDRVNIGNAVIIGDGSMLKDLGLENDPEKYSFALSIFFIGYLLFEVPSNVALKWATPSKWIARIMVTWGVVASCTAAVRNFAGLVAVRFFLGAAEAGFFPGVVYYFSFWFRAHEQAKRISLFFCAVSVAGAFSGLLASAIGLMQGIGGLDAWMWLFIIEGVPTVICGILTLWMLPDFPGSPSNATWFGRPWLSAEEDELAKSRIEEHAPKKDDKTFDYEEFKKLFVGRDVTSALATYLLPVVYFCMTGVLYSISFYLPTIIATLGTFQTWQVQLLTVPLYLIGFIAAVSVSTLSDKWVEKHPDPDGTSAVASRAWLCIASFAVSLIGLAMWTAGISSWAGYVAGAFLLAGTQSFVPLFWAWAGKFYRGVTGHSVGIAWVNSVGNLGGFAAPYYFAGTGDTRFKVGFTINLALVILGMVLIAGIEVLRLRDARMKARRAVDVGSNL